MRSHGDELHNGTAYHFSSWVSSLLPSALAEEAKSEKPEASSDKGEGEGDNSGGSKKEEANSKTSDNNEAEAGDEQATEAGEGEEEGGAAEEEEEEPEDEYPAIREQCADSKDCANLKHHFEHCSEKVHDGKGHKGEDCVEELFHLMHCVDNCAAPKLFAKLK